MRLFAEFAEDAGVTHCNRMTVLHTFRRIFRSGIVAVQAAEHTVTFREAVRLSLHARRHRRPSTKADLRSYTNRFLRQREFADSPIRHISVSQCRELLERQFGHSNHVFRKAHCVLHSIFTFGIRQGWCDSNPTDGIAPYPINERRIEILNLRQIRSLLRACRISRLQCMEASIRLMLWCGIRPNEVQRLRWRDIDEKEHVVYVEPQNSKTGGARAVPLRGGANWLCLHKGADDAFIAPRDWVRKWRMVRQTAKLTNWQYDTLRHTFASMHLKHFHNIVQLQEEMGHRNCDLLRTRYLNLRNLSSVTARVFFQKER